MQQSLPQEVIDLILTLLPDQKHRLNTNDLLGSAVEITKEWIFTARLEAKVISNELSGQHRDLILKAMQALGMRDTIKPMHKQYACAAIFGSTGLCHFQIWKDLIKFHTEYGIQFAKIFLLCGDRPVHPQYDSLNLAFKHYPNDFKFVVSNEDIQKCKNEKDVMELISRAIKLPETLQDIPVISVYATGNKYSGEFMKYADTRDTIDALLDSPDFPRENPILFIGLLPHAIRQGIQAARLMKGYTIDTIARFHPYLDTIDTPLKGE